MIATILNLFMSAVLEMAAIAATIPRGNLKNKYDGDACCYF